MKPALKWTLIIGGITTLAGFSLGLAGTVIGMLSSYNTPGKSSPADMEFLSSNISMALSATAGGIIGLIILVIGLIVWLLTRQRTLPTPLKTMKSEPAG
jgi:biopolymer transport protein ExbB/TolQ